MYDVDVAVVGLGLSGLTALRELTARGIHCVGVDARDRFGGRTTQIVTTGGRVFEAGGEFLKPAHSRVRALMTELGVQTLPIAAHGDTVFIQHGERVVGGVPFAHQHAAREEYVAARAAFDQLVATIVVGRVHESPNAEWLDSMSVSEWVSLVTNDAAVSSRLSRELVSGLGGPGGDLSLLVALGYAAAAVPGETVYPDERVAGGGFAISSALAMAIPADRVILGSLVSRIDHSRAGVIISATGVNGSAVTIMARSVIVAMSPKLARSIEFSPKLPGLHEKLFDGWVQAFGTKSFLVYATPWWREAGLSGFASGDLTVRSIGDLSPADGSWGVLVAETHPPAGEIPDPARHREAVEAAIEQYLGVSPEPLLDFGTHYWPEDPLAGGCGSPLPPGLLTAFGAALGQSVGSIHFAGTESSDVGWGSMEGAVRAGERAARSAAQEFRAVEAV